jgi:hypothetical protein
MPGCSSVNMLIHINTVNVIWKNRFVKYGMIMPRLGLE